MSIQTVLFDKPTGRGGPIQLAEAWARVPPPVDRQTEALLREEILDRLASQATTLVAHYYVDPVIQDLAERSGGCVADSLEMARFGRDCEADTLIVAGVRFMGETAKILSPEKRIFMPDTDANCSLDLGCDSEEFNAFCDQHPDRTVVVYANTSAAVKARADWVVTSSVGLKIVAHLHAQGKKILWAPDRHLGSYIQAQTGADMLLWQGSCLVHDEFKARELVQLKAELPSAMVLAHPESPADVLAHADFIGSTSQMLRAAKDFPAQQFIIATDQRLLHKMQQLTPNKQFIAAPTGGNGASCKSCAFCPWMSMNTLERIVELLREPAPYAEIHVDHNIAQLAQQSLDRMLEFAANQQKQLSIQN